MRKILNTTLVIATFVVICTSFASCKAKEIYWEDAANDFEFGDPVAVKVVTKYRVDASNYYTDINCNNQAASNAYGYYDTTTYKTFIPIIDDTSNNGAFGYAVYSNAYSGDVYADYDDGGIWVTWKYKTDLDPNNSDSEDNVNKITLRDENGNPYYRPGYPENKYVERTASYKEPNVKSVKIKVIATDYNDGTNQVEKEITVSYSESASKTIENYETGR